MVLKRSRNRDRACRRRHLDRADPPGPDAAVAEAGLKALTTEFTTRRAAGARTSSVLPAIEQANADATWAAGFLTRLHALQPDRLTHDEWITYAMLDNDAGIMKDAAQFFWFDVPVTPYASPLRGLVGSLAAMPLGSETERQAFVDALNRLRSRSPRTRRAFAARCCAASSSPPRNCGSRCPMSGASAVRRRRAPCVRRKPSSRRSRPTRGRRF